MISIAAVFIGGGLGSLSRFLISNIVTIYFSTWLPVATLFSNFLSCLVFGVLLYFLPEKMAVNSGFRLLFITGFCGGFSTFSAFSFETAELFRTGNSVYAIANIIISVLLCVGIFYLVQSGKNLR